MPLTYIYVMLNQISGTAAKLGVRTAYHHFTLLLHVETTQLHSLLQPDVVGFTWGRRWRSFNHDLGTSYIYMFECPKTNNDLSEEAHLYSYLTCIFLSLP